MNDSGWSSHVEIDREVMVWVVRLSKYDMRRMHPDRLEQLKEAGRLIQDALAHPDEPTVVGDYLRAWLNERDEQEGVEESIDEG